MAGLRLGRNNLEVFVPRLFWLRSGEPRDATRAFRVRCCFCRETCPPVLRVQRFCQLERTWMEVGEGKPSNGTGRDALFHNASPLFPAYLRGYSHRDAS